MEVVRQEPSSGPCGSFAAVQRCLCFAASPALKVGQTLLEVLQAGRGHGRGAGQCSEGSNRSCTVQPCAQLKSQQVSA